MKHRHVKEILLSMPFFAVIFYMAVIGFILPLRPTYSVLERRYLEAPPSFSFSSLANGTLYDDISHWFADTFPGRDVWINTSNKLSVLQGFKFNYVDTSHITPSEDIPEVFTGSDTQAVETLPSPEETPEPEIPMFSMREQDTEFDELSIDETDVEMYSGAFKIGNTVFASQGFGKDASDRYIASLNTFADRCSEKGFNFYNVIAPTSIGILLSEETREKVGAADQGKIMEYLFSLYDDNINCVRTYDKIDSHSSEYVYYHTDHHWTGLGAYYAYLAFCESAGFYPVSLDEYAAIDEGEFLGSFAATAAQAGGIKRDNVTAYNPPGNISLFDSIGDRWVETDVILDERDGPISNKYNCYIGGDKKLCLIVNEDLDSSAPSCLVVKDSFGNPFSIYLSQHYKNVYVVDYRKINKSALEYAEQFNVDDIILCQSIGVSQSRKANGLMDQALNGIR